MFELKLIVLFRSTLDPMLYGNLFNAKFYTVDKFMKGHIVARPAQSSVHLHMRMRSSVHFDARAHPDRSCDQLARETC